MMLSPYEHRYYHLAGVCFQRIKQFEIADHYYRMALSLNASDPTTLIYRGEVQIMLGKVDDGLLSIKKGIENCNEDRIGDAEHAGLLARAKALSQQFSTSA